MNKKLIIPLFLCFLVFISCSSEKKDWKNAESENSITAYEDFLNRYSEGEFTDEARSRIETIYFEKAEAANTIEAFDDFLKRYSEGDFADKARFKIETLYFEKAEAANTIEAFDDFLKRYPEGDFADKAHFKIETIYFNQAKAANSINAYIDFSKRYPNTNFANEVEELLKKKGTIVELIQKELFLIEGLSKDVSDRLWLEYQGLLETESKGEYPKNGFILWYKREGFDSEKIKIASLSGKVGQVLGGTWSRRLLRKGQVVSYTQYDEFGRPKVTTNVPIETVILTAKFSIISSSGSQVKVLILSESKIVLKKQ